MTAGNDFDPESGEEALFSALLTPHRSLHRTGFVVVMVAFGAISLATAVVFLVIGAWPVVGFLGLDVLAIYWAFKVNFRSAKAYEEILITPSELHLKRVSHRGHVMEWACNPLWVRLDQVVHQEFGVERLYLVSRGRRVAVARFLGPGEKASFAKALTSALAAARRGPVYRPAA